MYWSKLANGFYHEAVTGPLMLIDQEGALRRNPAVPDDAVPVSAELYITLIAEQTAGKRIVTADDGSPTAVDVAFDAGAYVAAVRRRRDVALSASDYTQLADAGLTSAKRKLWSSHRKHLRDLPAMVEAAIANGEDPTAIAFPEAPAPT